MGCRMSPLVRPEARLELLDVDDEAEGCEASLEERER